MRTKWKRLSERAALDKRRQPRVASHTRRTGGWKRNRFTTVQRTQNAWPGFVRGVVENARTGRHRYLQCPNARGERKVASWCYRLNGGAAQTSSGIAAMNRVCCNESGVIEAAYRTRKAYRR